MKKFIVFLCILLMSPLSVFAYSSKVILGGETIGIDIKSKGVMIIGFYKVNGKYHKSDLVEGDIIVKVEDEEILSIEDLTNSLENYVNQEQIEITYLHGNKEKTTKIELFLENGVYKTGLYVKDGITGIGTLTFIDPGTNTYGALGHEIILNETKSIVEVKNGNILMSKVKSINKSRNGHVGSKEATILYDKEIGTIRKNTNKGIYGMWNSELLNKDTMEIASFNEIKSGDAYIYTVLKNNDVKKYKINIF